MQRDHRYDDIISLARPDTPGHPPMPREARAAQFSPYAALTGYEDAIEEAARLTDRRVEGDEEGQGRLNACLKRLKARLKERPGVRVTCFRPDEFKEGGAYVMLEGRLKKLNEEEQWLQLEDGARACFFDILEIEETGEDAGRETRHDPPENEET